MNTQHTPGPWHRTNGYAFIHNALGGEVAKITSSIDSDAQMEEHEANARLIAAAPELLDALKRMTEAAKDILGEPSTSEGYFDITEAEKLIAKAEGR